MPTLKQIARARELRRKLTPAEATLWNELKTWRKTGWHWRKQSPFRGWYLDFVCFTNRIVVELDGVHHQEDDDQIAKDAVRDRVIRREGFIVERYPNDRVRSDLPDLLDEIRSLAERPTLAGYRRPVPPDKREGG